MANPWLTIPLEDYEGHMSSQGVGQARLLSDVLARLLRCHRPRSLAVIGCAGGNGFDAAAAAGVHRLVGIDINLAYLRDAEDRFTSLFPDLELHEADVSRDLPAMAPVDLVYAALVFEYVDVPATLMNLMRMCRPGGAFVALLQLAQEGEPAVTPSPFTSLKRLESVIDLVAPDALVEAASAVGFTHRDTDVLALESGKRFVVLSFQAPDRSS